MLQWYSIQRARRNESPIVLGNLHLKAFADKLATTAAIGKRRQGELVWMSLGKSVDVQPAHLVG
jgi:hypothetical protein